VLDKIRRLVEMEMERKFGLMVILSGRTSLNDLLYSPPLDAISAHAGQRISLSPFTLADTREYIRRRVESAGSADISQVFEFEAITAIHELCAGLPDAVGNLCCKCLQSMDEEDLATVTTDLVEKTGNRLRLASAMQKGDSAAESVGVSKTNSTEGRLIARINGAVIRELPLNQGHILIGRDQLCEICIANGLVSRHHALVFNTKFGLKLVDLGSKNGTSVLGRKIRQHALKNNDVIDVGNCKIEYIAGDNLEAWFYDIDATDTFEPHNAASASHRAPQTHKAPQAVN
jgi:hypothetical protein